MRSIASMRTLAVCCLLAACGADAPSGGEAKSSVADIEAKSDKVEGLFTLLRNSENGKLHISIKPEQLGEEFIYHTHVVDGVAMLGHFRGNYGSGRVLKLRRHFDRIEFVEVNTNYYFDPESPLIRAQDANLSDSILTAEKIVAEDDQAIIVAMDDVLLKERLTQVKPSSDPQAKPGDRFVLGKLSEPRSKVVSGKSYPENTEITVEYVYENPEPVVRGGTDVTNSRSVSVQMQHSFIAMPDDGFKPRFDDYRVGYFTDQVTDLTSDSHTPYRDLINRWRLQKQDAMAFVSDPVKPITFWIENTTPHELRDTIRESALRWNTAFEKAGISNALEIKVQPDDAEWDAGDIRYNVLRWTSSPNPPFGGMGPSFSNPRTGEIIGADIMLEYSFVANFQRAQEVLQPRAFAGDETVAYCTIGQTLQQNLQFANLALTVQGVSDELRDQLFHDTLSMLILHEIGHTLGLNHNMQASQLHADTFDKTRVDAQGLSGSVMDYEALNVAPPGREQTLFMQTHPGPYDDWAIEFGYSQALEDPEEEAARLEAILSRSGEPELAFGNDADDMRAPGRGIDPRIQINDMSSDAIGYAETRVQHVMSIQDGILDQYQHYDSWHPLANAYGTLTFQWVGAARVVAAYVGGVYVNRLPPGSTDDPYTPVSLDEQKRAMAFLREYVFGESIFDNADVMKRLQPQRRGFGFFNTSEDPKLHDRFLQGQRGVLDYLLNPTRLKRMTDTRLYGNEYSVAALLDDLSDAIFEDDLRGEVSTVRQNVQVEYAMRLAKLVKGPDAGVDHVARSGVHRQLERILEWMERKRGGNAETRAHTGHVRFIVEQALKADA